MFVSNIVLCCGTVNNDSNLYQKKNQIKKINK